MKKSTVTSMLAPTAIAGLLAGAPVSGHAQAVDTTKSKTGPVLGLQQKVEVGNDITTLKVDSIQQVAPTTSGPVLRVSRNPSGIRVWGTNSVGSMNRNTNPLVIVNGVRLNADSSVRSPLDQIDPTTIETIEVLKGPAAVAKFGPDAAHGVIVITIKKK